MPQADPPGDDLERDEREIHRIFAALRAHAVEVSDDFRDRLRQRVEGWVRTSEAGPSPVRLIGVSLIEAINLVVGLVAADRGEQGDCAKPGSDADEP